jgi:hypothetical protein
VTHLRDALAVYRRIESPHAARVEAALAGTPVAVPANRPGP